VAHWLSEAEAIHSGDSFASPIYGITQARAAFELRVAQVRHELIDVGLSLDKVNGIIDKQSLSLEHTSQGHLLSVGQILINSKINFLIFKIIGLCMTCDRKSINLELP